MISDLLNSPFFGSDLACPSETYPTVTSRILLADLLAGCEPKAFVNNLAMRIAVAAAHAMSDFSNDETEHFVDRKGFTFSSWAKRLEHYLLEQDVVGTILDTFSVSEGAKLRDEFYNSLEDPIQALEAMIALAGDWWTQFENPDLEAGVLMQNRWLPAVAEGYGFDPLEAVQTFLFYEGSEITHSSAKFAPDRSQHIHWERILKLYASPVQLGLFELLRVEQGREVKKRLARENLARAGYDDPIAQAQCLGAM